MLKIKDVNEGMIKKVFTDKELSIIINDNVYKGFGAKTLRKLGISGGV